MTREIKFRLISPEGIVLGYEKWYPGHFTNEGIEDARPQWLYSTDGKYWYPSFIWHHTKSEFTGLKNSKGAEIYEGDIVRWKFLGDGYAKNEFSVGEVEYRQAEFVIKYISLGELQFEVGGTIFSNDFYGPEGREFSWDDIEIIGNVRQNPELLKK